MVAFLVIIGRFDETQSAPRHRTSACTGRAYAVRRFREVLGIHTLYSRR